MTTYLLALVLLLPLQQFERQFEQQLQALRSVREQLQLQQQQLERLTEVLEETQKPPPSMCAGAIQRLNGSTPAAVGPGEDVSVPLYLYSTVSRPLKDCLPSEIRVSVNFLDREGILVCSGVVSDVAIQRGLTENIHLEIKPWNLPEFIRWSNEPQALSPPRSLTCLGPAGLTQMTTLEMERVGFLEIYSTLLPSGGGVATAELRIDLVR